MEKKGEITFDREKLLGSGGYGQVYEGVWDNKRAAVKRILLINVDEQEEKASRDGEAKQEEEALRQLDHSNIIKLFRVEKDLDFR